jgi:hypothetical protein
VTGGTFTPANYVITYVPGGLTVLTPPGAVDTGGPAIVEVTSHPGPGLTPGPSPTPGSVDTPTILPSGPAGPGGPVDVIAPEGLPILVVSGGVKWPVQPPVLIAQVTPVGPDVPQAVITPAQPVEGPVVAQSQPYVAPHHPRKQDRN